MEDTHANRAGIPDLRPLPESFFLPSAETVAPELLGHWLVRRTPAGFCGGPIVETEAYLRDDPACHAAPGPTARNRPMFGPPGRVYVYFIYGCHYCVNAVCMPAGSAEAVLIRAIEPHFNPAWMSRRRGDASPNHLTNGPGKVCEALDIGPSLQDALLCDAQSPLFIAANPGREGFLAARGPLVKATRIGITRAASLPLRFYLQSSPSVSRKSRS